MSIEQQNERIRQAQQANQVAQGQAPFPIPGVEQWAVFHNITQELMNLIVAVEGNNSLDGAGKKAFVTEAAVNILKVAEMFEGDATFNEALSDFIDAFVAFKKTEQKAKELVMASQVALNTIQEAVMGNRAARAERAQPKIVVAAPRITLAGGNDTKRS